MIKRIEGDAVEGKFFEVSNPEVHEMYRGLVVAVWSDNRYTMSDYGIARYAAVAWPSLDGGWEFVTVHVGFEDIGPAVKVLASGRKSYIDYATEDASPALAQAYKGMLAAQYAAEHARQSALLAARERATVRKGKTVKVVRGRKIAKGTVAVVRWIGQTPYGVSVGLALDGPKGKLSFTAVSNVEVTEEVVA